MTKPAMRMCATLAVACSVFLQASAVQVSPAEASVAARNWLRMGYGFESRMGTEVDAVRALAETNGAAFHIVAMKGGGFVVLGSDTEDSPVVAVSAHGSGAPDERNPLWALLRRHLVAQSKAKATRRRLLQASAGAKTAAGASTAARWAKLLERDEEDAGSPTQRKLLSASGGRTAIADVRVGALVRSAWSQEDYRNYGYTSDDDICYNYYTPNHWPCGCVATAGAQLMRYHAYPTAAVTAGTYACSKGGSAVNLTMKGGTYDWDSMTLVPANGCTATGREAIGKLTYDVGVSVGMAYGSGGSSAADYMLAKRFADRFQYANAVCVIFSGFYSGGEYRYTLDRFKAAVIPNFDAGLPVVLGVSNDLYGHAVVGDGYGYSDGDFFIHVNLGWADLSGGNAWYMPPDIDEYTSIDSIVYNVYPTGASGCSIVSGRILSRDGLPVEGASVRAVSGGVTTADATSGAKGIYALKVSPGECWVVAEKDGQSVSNRVTVSACVSPRVDDSGSYWSDVRPKVGNVNGNDLTLDAEGTPDPPEPPEQEELTWYTTKAGAFAAATESGRRILLVYGRDTCGNTQATRDSTCEDGEVKAKLLAGYVLWYSNCDTQSAESGRYLKNFAGTLPGVSVIDPVSDTTIVGAGGYQSVSAMLALLEAAEKYVPPEPPANDDFAVAEPLTDASGSAAATNVGATSEAGEPLTERYSSTSTVWWKWTAPANGTAVFDTVGSDFDTVLGVYAGTGLSTLTRIATDDDSGGGGTSACTFFCTAGTTYCVCVGGYEAATGAIRLQWTLTEDPPPGELNWTYVIENGEAKLYAGWYQAAVSPKPVGEVVVPSQLGGYPVTEIGDSVFAYCDRMTSVTIPSTVRKIGTLVFAGCTALQSITVAADNRYYASVGGILYDRAKSRLVACPCVRASVEVPVGVTEIGSYAFYSCDVESIRLPDGLKVIDNYAFAQCRSLQEVNLPEGLEEIGFRAFAWDERIAELTIPSTVVDIGELVFEGWSGELKVADGNGRYAIQDRMLYDGQDQVLIWAPRDLTDVVVRAGTLALEQSAFESSAMRSITLPDTLEEIGGQVFWGCQNLGEIVIPASVRRIGVQAFSAGVLTNLFFMGNAPDVDAAKLFSSAPEDLTVYVRHGSVGWNGSSSDELPDAWPATPDADARKIAYWESEPAIASYRIAYELNGGTATSEMPSFYNEAALPMPLATPQRDDYTFAGWLMDGELVTELPLGTTGDVTLVATWEQTDLTVRTEKIGDYTWSYYVVRGEAVIGNMGDYGLPTWGRCAVSPAPVGEIAVPSSIGGFPVRQIGAYAFCQLNDITKVTVPAGVTVIAESAFDNMLSLTEVVLPEGVVEIGDSAFASSYSLSSISLPSTLRRIGERAFYNDMGLEGIFVPAGVECIGVAAFAVCCHLRDFRVAEANAFYKSVDNALYSKDGKTIYHWPTWKQIAIPEGVCDIADYAYDCNIMGMSDAEVTIPGTVTNVGAFAFAGRGIGNLTIEEGLVSMGEYAFDGNLLSQVVIPASVVSVGDLCFGFCDNLKTIAFLGDEPAYAGGTYGIAGDYESCPEDVCVYVKAETTGWRDASGELLVSWPRDVSHPCQVKEWDGRDETLPTVERLTWYTTKAGAFAAATESGRRILLVYGRDTCGNTQATRDSTCEDGEVKAKLLAGYVLWYSNCDTQSAESGRYLKNFAGTLPGVSVIDPVSDTTIVGAGGYQDVSAMLALLAAAENYVPPEPPANDDFAAAEPLTGASGSAAATNVGATSEAGEPLTAKYSSSSTVWWKWTAPANGTAVFDTVGSDFDTVLGVYAGTGLSTLTRIATDDDSGGGGTSACTFFCTAGTTYYVCVGGYGAATGEVVLRFVCRPEPVGVAFDAAGGRVEPSGKSVRPGEPFGDLPVPVRTGYAFDGWWNETYGTVTEDTIVRVGDGVTLHARWTAITYGVRFDANGGTGVMDGLTGLAYDTQTTLPACAFASPDAALKFRGWALSPEGRVAYRNGAAVSNLTADDGAVVTLYAVWSALPDGFSFAADETSAGKGGFFELTVYGGGDEAATSVKVNVAYGSAKAADLVLKQAMVSGADGVEQSNLRFPLTLNWRKGDTEPKTIVIPTAAGKAADAPKSLVWNLSDARGLPLAERTCCIGMIDAGADWNGKDVCVLPFVADSTGGKVSGGASVKPDAAGKYKAATLKATANRGYWFAGWYTADGDWVSGDLSCKVTPDGSEELSKYEARFVPEQPSLCGTYNGSARVNLRGMTVVKGADTSSDVYADYPITMTLSSAGKLSGALTVAGKKVSFKCDGLDRIEVDRDGAVWAGFVVLLDEKALFGRENAEVLEIGLTDSEEYMCGLAALPGYGDYAPLSSVEPGDASFSRDRSKESGFKDSVKALAGTYAGYAADGAGHVVPLSVVVDAAGKAKIAGKYCDGTALSASVVLGGYAEGTGGTRRWDWMTYGDAFLAVKSLGGGNLHLRLCGMLPVGSDTPNLGLAEAHVSSYSAALVAANPIPLDVPTEVIPRLVSGGWHPAEADPDFGVVRLSSGEDAIDILYASKNGVVTGLGKAVQSGVTVKFDAKTGLLTVTKGKEYTIQGVLGDYASACFAAGRINADGSCQPVDVEFTTLPTPDENYPWMTEDFVLTLGQDFGEGRQPSVRSEGSPIDLTVTGLPSGLKFDKKTGLVTGAPTKAGAFTVKVSYTYATRKITRTTTLVVSPRPEGLPTGTYAGVVTVRIGGDEERAVDYPFTATVDKNGALSGSATLFGKKASFKASGYDSVSGGTSSYTAVFDFKSVDKGWNPVSVALTVDGRGLSGSPDAMFGNGHRLASVIAWRNQSKDSDAAVRFAPYVGTYVAALACEGPFGRGRMTLSVAVDRKGMAKLAGTYADGTAFSASAPLTVVGDGDGPLAVADVAVVPKSLAQGALRVSLELCVVEGDDGEGSSVDFSCSASAAKYVRTDDDYAGASLSCDFAYRSASLGWVDPSVSPADTCLEVAGEDGAFEAATFAWKTKSTADGLRITGVDKRLSGPSMTFKLDDKTGLFSGTCGTYKIFGAMKEGACSGLGTAVGKDGRVVPVAVGVTSR